MNEKLIRDKIDYYISYPQLLKRYGFESRTGGAIFCPFHSDKNHRSAKLFKDEDGWRLFCFSEKRQYRVSHFVTEILQMNLSQFYKDQALDRKPDGPALNSRKRNFVSFIDDKFQKFKQGKWTIEQVFDYLIVEYVRY